MEETPLQFPEGDVRSPASPSIEEQFEALCREHPDVPRLFAIFAREIKKAGREHFGAKAIAERLRWYYATSTSGETPKINNNYTAYLARKLMEDDPENFAGFFRTRELRAARRDGRD